MAADDIQTWASGGVGAVTVLSLIAWCARMLIKNDAYHEEVRKEWREERQTLLARIHLLEERLDGRRSDA